MECLAAFLLTTVAFLVLLGSLARAQSKSARRRRIYQLVAKRYSGVYVAGGLFARPSISLRYGDARALFREVMSRGAYAGKCSELQIEWPDSRRRLELYRGGNVGDDGRLRNDNDGGNDIEEFLKDYVASGGQRDWEHLLSEGVRWQINRLRFLDGDESGIYVAIRRGRLVVRKAVLMSQYDELDEFLSESLSLYDQAMLTQAHGIEFVEPSLNQPLGDVVCKICGEDIEQELVYCRRCKTPHHRDCWRYNGMCSVYGCQETRYLEPRVVPHSPSGGSTDRGPAKPR